MKSKRAISLLALMLVPLGCGGDEEFPPPETIRIVPSSNNQSAPASAPLPAPLAVEVLDAEGQPAVRARVRWTAAAGGSVSDSVSLAGGDGIAIMPYRLGSTPGTFSITAVLDQREDRSAVFSATGFAAAAVTQVVPATYTGGDTLEVRGTGLSTVDVVQFGTVGAPPLSATETSIAVIAPVCLDPGSIDLSVVQRGIRSGTVPTTYTAGAGIAGLAPGQYVSIAAVDVAGCASFPTAGNSGAEYLMVVQSVTGTPGVTASYRLRGDTLAPTSVVGTAVPAELSFADRFHNSLREREAEVARMPKPEQPLLAVGPEVAVNVGDSRAFRVCNKIGCQSQSDFDEVDAEARFVGNRTILYSDKNSPGGGFTDVDFETFGQLIDGRLYGVASSSFGVESDVDRNGRVAILFTPTVNGLNSPSDCGNSIFVGFFFGVDIDPSFAQDDRSNKGEVFYALTPDPNGFAGCTVSLDGVRNLVPVTLVHELQHMISYNQHVLVRGGDKEVLWLDEALSHAAEEIAARDFLTAGDEGSFSQFATGNLSNLYRYLRTPTSFSPVATEGTGSLEERGASWWLVRWVLDHFGDGSPRLLVETSATGIDNIEAFAGEPIEGILTEWALATFVSDLPGFSASDRLSFDFWRLRNVFEGFNRQSPSRFPLAFPVVPPVFGGAFGQVTGAVRSGSGDYFQLVQPPMGPGFSIELTNGTGGPTQDGARVRLNVLRVR